MKTDGTLVILTPGFAASEDDSTCLPMLQSLVRTFHDLYPELKIVIFSFQYPYIDKTYTWNMATVQSFNGRNRGGIRRLWLRRTILASLEALRKREKIVGLLSFWYNECAAVGKLFGEKNNIPHYCWLLGQDAKSNNTYPFSYQIAPEKLIALSDFLQKEFQQNHARTPEWVIPLGIREADMPRGNGQRDIDLLAAGSLIPLKQFKLFVEAVAKVKKTLPNVRAILIGDGPEKNEIEQLIASRSLQQNIILTGQLPYKEVLKKMQRARVFLHPSRYEGFGLVTLEALCGGAKVVSFVKPMEQKIEDWQIVATIDEMADKAASILNDQHVQYKSQLPFSMEQTVQRLKELFVPDHV